MQLFRRVYGTLVYVVGLSGIAALIAFLGNFGLPVGISRGDATELGTPLALAVDGLLIAIFGLQHALLTRSAALERSTHTLFTCLALGLLIWQWQPVPVLIWRIEGVTPRVALYGLFALGWIVALLGTLMIDHFGLFGVRQCFTGESEAARAAEFRTPALYRWMRHPIDFGVLLAVWSTPWMTLGQLLFAVSLTCYVLLQIRVEERDLERRFGEIYVEYKHRTRMLLPIPKRLASKTLSTAVRRRSYHVPS